MRYVLGFDGGGTKTDCVLMDENRVVVGRGQSGILESLVESGSHLNIYAGARCGFAEQRNTSGPKRRSPQLLVRSSELIR